MDVVLSMVNFLLVDLSFSPSVVWLVPKWDLVSYYVFYFRPLIICSHGLRY
jgi:hypothetical protein